jgi:hypothetical protein
MFAKSHPESSQSGQMQYSVSSLASLCANQAFTPGPAAPGRTQTISSHPPFTAKCNSISSSPALLAVSFVRSLLDFSSTFFRSSRTTSKCPSFYARCRAVKPYPRGGLASRNMRTTAVFPAFAASAEYPPPPPCLCPVRNFTRSSFSALSAPFVLLRLP